MVEIIRILLLCWYLLLNLYWQQQHHIAFLSHLHFGRWIHGSFLGCTPLSLDNINETQSSSELDHGASIANWRSWRFLCNNSYIYIIMIWISEHFYTKNLSHFRFLRERNIYYRSNFQISKTVTTLSRDSTCPQISLPSTTTQTLIHVHTLTSATRATSALL